MVDSLTHVTRLLTDHPLVDGHNDLPWAARSLTRYDFDALEIAGDTSDRTHTDLPRLRAGRVGMQFWSVYVPATLTGGEAVTATLEQIDAVHRMVARYPDRLGLATTAEQARAVFDSGRIASLMGAEGGHSIDNSLGTLRMLYALGVRYLTLTHNNNVAWADSATDEPEHHGLTAFGRVVVREMNRLGMLVDLSHVSPDTMRDALATTRAPAIFSHSGARAVADHVRNAPDDVLTSLAANDGVIMATFVPGFINPDAAAWVREANAAAQSAGVDPRDPDERGRFMTDYARTRPQPRAGLQDVVAHVEHLREVAGVDHVGVGGDYDGVDRLPEGLEDVSGYPRLFAALAERGWSDEDLVKLSGANVLRVLGRAEQVAEDLRDEPAALDLIEDVDG